MRRSTRLLIVGLVALLVSAGIVLVSMAGSDDPPAAAAQPGSPDHVGEIDDAADLDADGVEVAQADPVYAERLADGRQAVSIRLSSAPGLAGYVAAGDRVNVHAVIDQRNDDPAAAVGPHRPPLVQLTLSALVLDVHSSEPGEEGTVAYLLELAPPDVERLIFLASFESIWLSLVGPDDEPPVTPGRTYADLL